MLANTVAYWDTETSTTIKSFIVEDCDRENNFNENFLAIFPRKLKKKKMITKFQSDYLKNFVGPY
jgi:hypothetical protein